MNNEELTTQVSALDIKQGTVVVLRLGSDTPVSAARTMGEELRKLVPFGNLILVLPNGESIEALDEAQMREIGWVRWSTVEQLVGCAELLASNLRRDAESVPDDDESVGLLYHADQVDAIVRRVKGIEPELPLG